MVSLSNKTNGEMPGDATGVDSDETSSSTTTAEDAAADDDCRQITWDKRMIHGINAMKPHLRGARGGKRRQD